MRYFFIDLENVRNEGLEGVLSLNEKDMVYIFYSENAFSMAIPTMESITNSKCSSKFIKTNYIGKNAMDFQIVSLYAAMIERCREGSFYIISKDNGFRSAVSFCESYFSEYPIKCGVYPRIISALAAQSRAQNSRPDNESENTRPGNKKISQAQAVQTQASQSQTDNTGNKNTENSESEGKRSRSRRSRRKGKHEDSSAVNGSLTGSSAATGTTAGNTAAGSAAAGNSVSSAAVGNQAAGNAKVKFESSKNFQTTASVPQAARDATMSRSQKLAALGQNNVKADNAAIGSTSANNADINDMSDNNPADTQNDKNVSETGNNRKSQKSRSNRRTGKKDADKKDSDKKENDKKEADKKDTGNKGADNKENAKTGVNTAAADETGKTDNQGRLGYIYELLKEYLSERTIDIYAGYIDEGIANSSNRDELQQYFRENLGDDEGEALFKVVRSDFEKYKQNRPRKASRPRRHRSKKSNNGSKEPADV